MLSLVRTKFQHLLGSIAVAPLGLFHENVSDVRQSAKKKDGKKKRK